MHRIKVATATIIAICLFPLASTLDPTPHILYLTDCKLYSDWQAVGMAFAFKNSGYPGKITRVMCCKDEEKAAYTTEMLQIMDTHIAPSFEWNEKTHDHYAPFNKPGAVLDFMQHGKTDAEYMMVIDSDMILRHPFELAQFKLLEGEARSADYRYMVGCTNDLALRHIPEIGPRNETKAGPYGRRCDEVGGWVLMKRSDLERVAPMWLSYTVDVREDDMAWNLTGDSYVEKGGKAWISEMYGYAFACAKAHVWHTWDTTFMHYPTYRASTSESPHLTHYGLEFGAGKDWSFDKHHHYDFDPKVCPPWDLANLKRPKNGIFEHGPRASELTSKDDPQGYYHDLMAIETIETLNAGFCDYHLNHCPDSLELLIVCEEALRRYIEIKVALRDFEANNIGCTDSNPKCKEWANEKQCGSNPGFMKENCKESCGLCKDSEDTRIRGDAEGRYKGQILEPTEMPGVVDYHAKIVILAKNIYGKRMARKEESLLKDYRPKGKKDEAPADKDKIKGDEDYYLNKPMDMGGLQDKVQNPMTRCSRLTLSMEETAKCIKAVKAGLEYVVSPHKSLLVSADARKKLLEQTSGAPRLRADHGSRVVDPLPIVGSVVAHTGTSDIVVGSTPSGSIAHFWILMGAMLLFLIYSFVSRVVKRRPKPGMRKE